MLKVLIADDEKKICQLIEKLVDWDSLGMQVIGTAENGIEALEKIRETHPDIVITDIRMPGYDGLELIRLGKEYNPKTEFIIISGYRHFEYAQTAICYGVNAYVLKPIRKEELVEILSKLKERFQEKTDRLSHEEQMKLTLKSGEEALRQTFFADIVWRRNPERLHASLEEINPEFHFSFRPGEFCIVILKMDGRVFDDQKNLLFMAEKMQNEAKRLLAEWVWDYEITGAESFFYILLNFEKGQKGNVRRQIKLLLDEMRVQGGILKDFSVTLALGSVSETIEGLEASLKNARFLIEERLVLGTGKLLEGDFFPEDSFAKSKEFVEFNRRMSQALESLEVFAVRDAIMDLKMKMLAAEGITGHDFLQMAKEIGNHYLFFMKNYRISIEEDFWDKFSAGADNCASASELFDYVIRTITSSYEKAAQMKRQDENRPIRIVKQFAAKHYGEPLTLEQVSALANLSPAYFSTVFKKDTGMTFLEYLSKIRMDAAKQLLKETSCTVADICQQVGYSDVKYFTKTFTKYSGLKPNEYRKLYS